MVVLTFLVAIVVAAILAGRGPSDSCAVQHLGRRLPYQRFAAFLIDLTPLVVYANVFGLSRLTLGLAVAYWQMRDTPCSGSMGKALCGLRIVSWTDDAPPGLWRLVLRNTPFVLPIVNLVAIADAIHTFVKDDQERHVGDRLARTKVVFRERQKEQSGAVVGAACSVREQHMP